MRLAASRKGERLEIGGQELPFSFFMMRKTVRRWGVNHMIYASDPWAVISGSVTQQVPAGPNRDAALSFVRQAREYFKAAERADTIETQPLLYYYSFLNLGKALGIARAVQGRPSLIGRVAHGVAPDESQPHTLKAALKIHSSTASSPSALDELHWALEGTPVASLFTSGKTLSVADLVAQSVVGHRLWREEGTNRKERFLTVEKVDLRHDPTARTIWASLVIKRETMDRRKRSVTVATQEGGLEAFRAVESNHSELRVFEQIAPVGYTSNPSDKVMEVVKLLRPVLWQTVKAGPPYRGYYLYLAPNGEQRVPQWMSIYAILFWLGSLTRYRPVELLRLLDGAHSGAFLREFLAAQPQQLLYMCTSEFKRQDVAKADVV